MDQQSKAEAYDWLMSQTGLMTEDVFDERVQNQLRVALGEHSSPDEDDIWDAAKEIRKEQHIISFSAGMRAGRAMTVSALKACDRLLEATTEEEIQAARDDLEGVRMSLNATILNAQDGS